MKTVLFALQTAHPVGGVQTWVDSLARLLPDRGWRVIGALAWGARFHDPFEYRRLHSSLETVLLDGRSGTGTGKRLAFERAFDSVRPDVVVPVSLAEAFPALAERKSRGGSVRLLYGCYEVGAPMLLDVERYASFVDRGIGVSGLTTALLVEAAGLPRGRVVQVPPGVPIPRPRLPAVGGVLRIGYVGRLDPSKRPLDIVRLCRALDAGGVRFEMTVVGRGELEGALREAGNAYVQSGRLRVLPAVTTAELYETVYRDLDALAFFSERTEGLPSVLLESMAHGVVPLTSDWEGLEEEGTVRHGITGLVFPPGRPEDAVAPLKELRADEAAWRRVSEAGRKVVEERHTLEGMADGWARSLEASLEGAPARGGPPPVSWGRDRLAGLVGARLAEGARKLAGRRWTHSDAEEWWFTGSYGSVRIPEMEARIEAVRTALRSKDGARRAAAGAGGAPGPDLVPRATP